MEPVILVTILAFAVVVTWTNFRMYRALVRFVDVARRWVDADIRIKRAKTRVEIYDSRAWMAELIRRITGEKVDILRLQPLQWNHEKMGSLEGLLAVLADGRRAVLTHMPIETFLFTWRKASRLPDFTLLPPFARPRWWEVGLYNGGEFVDQEYRLVSGHPAHTPLFLILVPKPQGRR